MLNIYRALKLIKFCGLIQYILPRETKYHRPNVVGLGKKYVRQFSAYFLVFGCWCSLRCATLSKVFERNIQTRIKVNLSWSKLDNKVALVRFW